MLGSKEVGLEPCSMSEHDQKALQLHTIPHVPPPPFHHVYFSCATQLPLPVNKRWRDQWVHFHMNHQWSDTSLKHVFDKAAVTIVHVNLSDATKVSSPKKPINSVYSCTDLALSHCGDEWSWRAR